MTSTRYVSRELSRSKRGNLLVWSSIVVSSFITTIISSLIAEYYLVLTPDSIPKINFSLINYFQQLIIVLWILSFITGAIVIFGTVTSYAQNRQRDIALAKSIGAGRDFVYGVFMFTLMFLVISAIITGVFSGILVAPLISSGNSNTSFEVQLLYLVTFLVFFGFAYVTGYRPTINIFRKTTVDALHFASPIIKPFTGFAKWLSRKSPINRLVLKNLFRLHTKTRYLMAILFTAFFFLSFSSYGYAISTDTSVNYLERGYGENVVIIAKPEMTDYLESLYSINEPLNISNFNLNNPQFYLNDSTINTIQTIPGVETIAPRSIQNMYIEEYPKIQISGDDYILIGQRRNTTTLVIGYSPSKEFLDLHSQGLSTSSENSQSAVIGDTLGFQLFDDPLLQFVRINGTNTEIAGVQIDPFARGRAVYFPYAQFESLTGIAEYNALWVKIDSQNYSSTLEQIQSFELTEDYEVIELNPIRDSAITQYRTVYLPLTLIALLIGVMTFIVLSGYLMTNSQRTLPDYLLAWHLGISRHKLPSMIRLEAFFLIVFTAPLGIILGFLSAYLFLVTTPILNNLTFIWISLFLITISIALIFSTKILGFRLFKIPAANMGNK